MRWFVFQAHAVSRVVGRSPSSRIRLLCGSVIIVGADRFCFSGATRRRRWCVLRFQLPRRRRDSLRRRRCFFSSCGCVFSEEVGGGGGVLVIVFTMKCEFLLCNFVTFVGFVDYVGFVDCLNF